MKLEVKTLDGKSVGEIDLPESVFGLPVRADILQRMVRWQLARRQAGTHKTKGISEISGTTAKPFKQKGTGHARQGSKRSPQYRGGATIFGPVVRSHAHDLTKKFRKLGLKTALSAKLAAGKVVVLEDLVSESGKTRDLLAQVKALGLEKALFIGGNEVDIKFALASRNIPTIDVLPQQGANVYDILRRDTLVLTKEAIKHLEERLQ
ncbi:50S ribosomal protein L4 [Phaeovibrio sulfidiphilus]|uniref:Large ribosomal subunit protein uL4 n=1 Tax=Phaeovibrio sulfidiphilus TaxID=1220600 RepID=A0A8J6YKK4_9PROT|nr:50S ribosomal protein L4 [Phaeovibrio sulfidiphilus]MBE1236295.1 50S ribosomal protein L4 [Phaeovibrio sulfidiphilus]